MLGKPQIKNIFFVAVPLIGRGGGDKGGKGQRERKKLFFKNIFKKISNSFKTFKNENSKKKPWLY